jgi:Domain of unknown function (DUF4082)/Bacterial Ig-like domain
MGWFNNRSAGKSRAGSSKPAPRRHRRLAIEQFEGRRLLAAVPLVNVAADSSISPQDAAATLAIASVSPTDGGTNVPVNATVTVQFNNAMNASTVNSSTVALRDSQHNAIAAAVTFDSGSNTATLTPTGPLVNSTTYTLTVSGGAGGVADTSGDTLPSNFTSSFSTPAAPTTPTLAQGQFSLWSNSTVPGYTDNPDSNSVELGVQFQANQVGYVMGIRYYKATGNVGTHVGNLWSSGGTQLASATFSSEAASGWQQVSFSQPILIQANTTYIASYFAPSGNYADDLNFFASGPFSNGPLKATGSVYLNGNSSAFPTQTYSNSNYYVDVVFSPLIGAISPASGATGVATNATVSVQFLGAMNAGTVNASTLTLQDSLGNAVVATVNYDAGSTTATLTPSAALNAGTTYTLTISGGAGGVADANGNTLPQAVSSTFTTVPSAPAVLSVIPSNSASGVDAGASIQVQFNEAMNSATITSGTLLLQNVAGNLAVGVSYDSATDTATLTPTAPLTTSSTYTVVVTGGADGVMDSSGNSLAANFTSSFTTAAPLGPGPDSVWSDATVPAWVDNPDGKSVELGLKFESASAGYITGIRFYKSLANSGTHTVSLWTADGNLLATATSETETDSGWQEVDFSQPVYIHANQVYLATYLAPTGNYSDDLGYFGSGSHTNGPLTALGGVYSYTSTNVLPTESYDSSNYWVDVVLTSLVGSVTPRANATNVATDSTVTVHFNAPMNADTIDTSTMQLADSSNNSITATVSYDAASQTATLTPSASLTSGTTYTLSIQGGASGVADTSGNTLTAAYTSSFTTAATVPTGATPVSLWKQSATPSWIDNPDSQAVELGVKFQSSVAGFITGITFYKSANNTGTHVANLWSADGTLLATATFSNETATGWQSVSFSQPVFVQANTTYIASYHTDTGNYSDDEAFFANSGLTSGQLSALSNSAAGGNGVYAYGAGGIFPTKTFNSSNYWVDVLFVPES